MSGDDGFIYRVVVTFDEKFSAGESDRPEMSLVTSSRELAFDTLDAATKMQNFDTVFLGIKRPRPVEEKDDKGKEDEEEERPERVEEILPSKKPKERLYLLDYMLGPPMIHNEFLRLYKAYNESEAANSTDLNWNGRMLIGLLIEHIYYLEKYHPERTACIKATRDLREYVLGKIEQLAKEV